MVFSLHGTNLNVITNQAAKQENMFLQGVARLEDELQQRTGCIAPLQVDVRQLQQELQEKSLELAATCAVTKRKRTKLLQHNASLQCALDTQAKLQQNIKVRDWHSPVLRPTQSIP